MCNLIGGVTVDRFDNSYFGIHRLQTVYMDPIHRLSLERTFEAIIDAGKEQFCIFCVTITYSTSNLILNMFKIIEDKRMKIKTSFI